MVLPWALAFLSLLPLLEAQSPACINFTVPITNATMDQISGKGFLIASAYRYPEYKEMIRSIQAAFFYLELNYTEDTFLLREYLTMEGQCNYTSSDLKIHRENGTLSTYDRGKEQFVHLAFTKDPHTFMLAFFPGDEQNMGLSFYADKPEVTPEQMRQFQESVLCMGMSKSEIVYTDDRKDVCGPLEKQHNEERRKEKDSPKEKGK